VKDDDGRSAASTAKRYKLSVAKVDELLAAHFAANKGAPPAIKRNIARERAIERDPVYQRIFQRAWKRSKSGTKNFEKAWRFAVAEELAKGQPWPRLLMLLAAFALVEQYMPKFQAKLVREVLQPGFDRDMIGQLAERMKASGVPNPRGEAEKIYAEAQNITVDALHKRRYRKS
jgi:hypothetical protein